MIKTGVDKYFIPYGTLELKIMLTNMRFKYCETINNLTKQLYETVTSSWKSFLSHRDES